MIRLKGFYILFLLWLLPTLAFAQYFRNLNVVDGLPNSIGKCFAQDGQGFVWVGTFNGLTRYDGFHFTTYRHVEGDTTTLSSSHIESLYYDGNNGLWVGSQGGIDYMSLVDRKITHCKYVDIKTKQEKNIPSGYVWQIIKSGSHLWAVNTFSQLFYKTADDSMLWHQLLFDKERIKAVADYDGKHLLVLTDNKLRLLDSHTLAVKAICHIKPIDASYLCNVYYSRNQRLVFVGLGYGSSGLTFSIQSQGNKVSGVFLIQQVDKQLPYHIKAVCDYADMTLFATDGQGLKVMKNGNLIQSWSPQYDQIAGNAIHALFVDKDKTLWMGTYREGICLYSHRFDYFKSLTKSDKQLNYDVVSAVSADESKIYIGTDGGGLNIYDRASRLTRSLTPGNSDLPGSNIVALLSEGKYLWMGIYGKGICVMDKQTGSIKTLRLPAHQGQEANLYSMWHIVDDHQGHLLFGGDELYIYDKQAQRVTPCPLRVESKIRQISVDGHCLWIVTNKNLLKVNLQTFKQERVFLLPRQALTVSLYAQGNRVFLSEQNGNLWELKVERGSWDKIASEELTNKEVESIQPDGLGNLWLGTDHGLFQYNLSKGTIKSYGQEDHLLPYQYLPNAVFHDGNDIYMGSIKGLIRFNPLQFHQKAIPTKVYFDDFFVLGNHEHLSLWGEKPEALELSHDQNFFTISFSVPELVTPHKIRFRYQLKGLDKDWREIEDVREISYTNVSPGSYVFLIQASNNDGSWSDNVSELAIHISHPWYASWWARLLWILIIIGIVYAIFRHYAEKQQMKHEIEQKEQEKQHEVAQKELEKEMIQKNNEDKLNFFANITHELRTPMFLITAPLEELLSSAQRPVQVPYSYLRGMYRNAVRLNKLVSSILDLRKMEAGNLRLKVSKRDMVKVCKRLSVDYRALCLQKNITFRYETSLESLGADVDIEKFELIFSNLIANAYKYTNEGGQVTLRLSSEDNRMKLVVSDTGIGIAKDKLSKIFDRYYRVDENCKTVGDGLGLAFVKSLVELHQGTISVESEEGKGTSFVVFLPLVQPDGVKISIRKPIVEGDLQLDESDEMDMEQVPGVEELIQSPTATQAILIIDDERETVQLLERYLCKDYKIFKAGDGEEGLRVAAEVMPDLVICDVMMPKMDGFEFLGKFKDDKKLQHIPVFMFIAKILDEDKISAFRYGADAYLTKPVSLKFLKARIESFLQRNTSSLQNANLAAPSQTPSVGGTHYTKEEQKFILRCKEIIDKNLREENFGVDFMASELGMSHSAFYKKVKAITGKSAVDMIVEYRIFKAVEMMRNGETHVTKISELCGFNDIRSFRSAFRARIGMAPKQFLQQI